MSEKIKEYIECRIFILGDENVGKKSFVKKILNLPSTGVIRNAEAEEEYDKLCQKINEEIEKDRIKEEQQKALLASINNQKKNSEKDYDKTSRFPSSNTLFKIDEEKSISHKPSNKNLGKLLDKSNQNYIPTSSNNHKPSNRILDPLGSFNQKKYRQPVPEYPAKLYCVNVDKIVIKLFCIPKAERRPLDFIPQDDDEEYGLEKEHNCSFDGIRKDLNEKLKIKDTIISQDKLYGFNTSIFTLFVFLYDLSNFYSFESLILYYSKLKNEEILVCSLCNCIFSLNKFYWNCPICSRKFISKDITTSYKDNFDTDLKSNSKNKSYKFKNNINLNSCNNKPDNLDKDLLYLSCKGTPLRNVNNFDIKNNNMSSYVKKKPNDFYNHSTKNKDENKNNSIYKNKRRNLSINITNKTNTNNSYIDNDKEVKNTNDKYNTNTNFYLKNNFSKDNSKASKDNILNYINNNNNDQNNYDNNNNNINNINNNEYFSPIKKENTSEKKHTKMQFSTHIPTK